MIIGGGETKNDRMKRKIEDRRQKHGRDIAERICQVGRRKETAGRKLDVEVKVMTAEENGWKGCDVERIKHGKEWYERRNEMYF